jgi:hypothetical protein
VVVAAAAAAAADASVRPQCSRTTAPRRRPVHRPPGAR